LRCSSSQDTGKLFWKRASSSFTAISPRLGERPGCTSAAESQQVAAVDAPDSVLHLAHRIDRDHRHAVRPDHDHALRRPAVERNDVLEGDGARPIDRLVARAHHGHEVVRRLEHGLDAGRGERERRRPVVAQESLKLVFDHLADCRAVGVGHGHRFARGLCQRGDAMDRRADVGSPGRRHGRRQIQGQAERQADGQYRTLSCLTHGPPPS
jgi:hypothetical protein